MSLGRREELVRLARKYDALLVTDDVYDFLQWSPTPGGKLSAPEHACLPRLVDVDRYLDGGPIDEWGHAISNGSFSKLLGPGLRTGWAEASEKVAYGLSQVYVLRPLCFYDPSFWPVATRPRGTCEQSVDFAHDWSGASGPCVCDIADMHHIPSNVRLT